MWIRRWSARWRWEQRSRSPWLTSFMVTVPAPLKIPGDTSGPSRCIWRTFRRKRCSAAWPHRQKSRRPELASNTPYQPDGYQSVIPYLHVNGAARLIAFMKDVFNAQEIAVYPRPDGTVGHAALRVGDSVIELADVSPEWPAMPCALQVYVPDADAAYHRALKAGASSL